MPVNRPRNRRFRSDNEDFRCRHCKRPVSASPAVSGVQHRNHCPYCLYSLHVDQVKAGDRDAPCEGAMEPIGLTLKQTNKKYGPDRQGELMLIHNCLNCGKISINRVAADDDSSLLMQIFGESQAGDLARWQDLEQSGVHVAGAEDEEVVRARLFGRGN